MSWYRTYRPQTFSDLVGQDHVRKILLTSLQKDNVVHAYLFSGPRGTGKTSTARIFAKALNCEKPTSQGEPCNNCANCQEIDEQRFVDVIEIDAASNTGVDHIRDLRDKIGFSPTSGKAKIYIIDEVHMLSMGAFNALLKTLEEPPDFVYFILATTELHKVPETIQSRCQKFSFRRLTQSDIVQRLLFIAEKENITAEKEALEIIASQAGGGLRDAISLFEQHSVSGKITADTLRNQMGLVSATIVEEFLEKIESSDASGALEKLDNIVREGFSLSEFVRSFLLLLREKILEASKKDEGIASFIELAEVFDEAQRKIKFAVIPQLPLEIAIVKATILSNKKPEDDGKIFGIFGGEKKENVQKQKDIQKKKEEQDLSQEDKTLPAEKDEKKADFIAPELNLKGIKSAWPQIIEKTSGSLLRMSLKNANITDFTEKTLTLSFPAETWKEQVEKIEHTRELLNAFQEVFSQEIRISCILSEVQLEPTIMEEPEEDDKKEDLSPLEALQEIMGVTAEKKE